MPQSQAVTNASDTKREEEEKTKLLIHINEEANARDASRLASLSQATPRPSAASFLVLGSREELILVAIGSHFLQLYRSWSMATIVGHRWEKSEHNRFVNSFAGNKTERLIKFHVSCRIPRNFMFHAGYPEISCFMPDTQNFHVSCRIPEITDLRLGDG